MLQLFSHTHSERGPASQIMIGLLLRNEVRAIGGSPARVED